MKIAKTILCTAASLGALAAIGVVTAPKISAAIKAAYVQLVLPDRPWTDVAGLGSSPGTAITGPGTGTLGVTSVTISNSDPNPQRVFLFSPTFAGGASGPCATATQVGVVGFYLTVPGNATLHLPYPSPMVFSAAAGSSPCLGITSTNPSRTGGLDMNFTGYIN